MVGSTTSIFLLTLENGLVVSPWCSLPACIISTTLVRKTNRKFSTGDNFHLYYENPGKLELDVVFSGGNIMHFRGLFRAWCENGFWVPGI